MEFSADEVKMLTKVELDGINDLQNRIMRACYDKCVGTRVKEGELHVGEMTCVDRCVPKYFAVHELVRAEFQKLQPSTAPAAAPGKP